MSSSFFKSKVVIVTGSGQGIGKATAQLIGSYGAKICLNGRNPDKLKATEKELREQGVDCVAIPADLSDPKACEHLVNECIRHYGKLDVLINNAGVASRGRIAEMNPETWDDTMKINFHSAINCSFYALPHLKETKGSIILVSSMAAKVGLPGHASYSASKMALTAYARALQNEYKKDELHCGLVFVGFTANETQKTILGPDGKYAELPKRKGLKLASREDVAKEISNCIVKRKSQVTLSFMGKMQHVLLKFFPGIIYALLRKSYKSYDSDYKG